MMADEGRRKLAAILAADVAGYSRLMADDDRATVRTLTEYRAVFFEHISAHYGRVVDTAGDSVLATFDSVVEAIEAAIEIQHELSERNELLSDHRRMQFRIGVNLGDIIVRSDETVYGDGVNVAARLEGLAVPGGLMASGSAFDQVDGKVAFDFEFMGEQTVKNIARPVRAYRAKTERVIESEPAPIPLLLPSKPSIAVLPFENRSGESQQDYFADGITEDIITEVSKFDELFVISRNSTFAYKGKTAIPQDVCRDLGVKYVLDGSVRKAGDRVRVTTQLIDGKSGGHLWGERYDRELVDIFAVQDDITAQIVRALQIRFVDAIPAVSSRVETDNPEAYDCVLRGRERYRQFTTDGNAAAQTLYKRAIALDPNYAEAHAGLAETYWQDWFLGSPDGLDRAFELAQTAKGLDPSQPLVYEALSSVYLFKRQHQEAVAAAERWIEVEPGNAEAYANLAGMLHFAGEPERVIELIDRAKRLNPYYPFYYNLYVGQAQFTMRHFEDAVLSITRSIAHNPESLPSHIYLAACYGQLGNVALAKEALEDVWRMSPNFSLDRVRSIAVYRRANDLNLLVEGLHKAGLSN